MAKWHEFRCLKCGRRQRRYGASVLCENRSCRGTLERLEGEGPVAAPGAALDPEAMRAALLRCAAHAGHPDPAEGCRLVVRAVKEALAGEGE